MYWYTKKKTPHTPEKLFEVSVDKDLVKKKTTPLTIQQNKIKLLRTMAGDSWG